jgi:aldehyde dehydrogenase (NAD(P)+)
MPKDWSQKTTFIEALESVISSAPPRALYYPGAKERLAEFCTNNPDFKTVPRSGTQDLLMSTLDLDNLQARSTEVFAPALNVVEIGSEEAEAYLIAAIEFANTRLYGTLGANIVIHPATLTQIGRSRLEEILADLRYGTIAINAWTGLSFLSTQSPWGAFPGHTLADVQSGMGVVHNTLLFEKTQRTVVEAPFRPFPRNLLSLSFTLLPRPPWFITNRKAAILGKLLVAFQHRPSLLKMPRIFWNALQG